MHLLQSFGSMSVLFSTIYWRFWNFWCPRDAKIHLRRSSLRTHNVRSKIPNGHARNSNNFGAATVGRWMLQILRQIRISQLSPLLINRLFLSLLISFSRIKTSEKQICDQNAENNTSDRTNARIAHHYTILSCSHVSSLQSATISLSFPGFDNKAECKYQGRR